MIFNFKRSIIFLKTVILIIFILFLLVTNITTYTKIYNQNKYKELRKFLEDKTISLILQTVTGDQRYKNIELSKKYKDLQIIHILVISGGNVAIILGFIHIFIYRKNMTNYILSLIFIFIYGKLIYFPETLVRALQSIIILKISEYLGVKFSTKRSFIIIVLTFLISVLLFNYGKSYFLSAVYSVVIFINSNFLQKVSKNKTINFIISNLSLTITSSILFNFDSFFITCTSFVANIFITLFYDFAILLAYIVYFMPTDYIPNILRNGIIFSFQLILNTINLTSWITYNICNG